MTDVVPDLAAPLADALRRAFEKVVHEPIPAELLALLERLE